EQLVFDYDPATQDSASNAQCEALRRQIDDLHDSVNELVATQTPNIFVPVHSKPQELLESTQNYPVYLEHGDRLIYHIETEKTADVRIYNADSHKLLKSYTGKSQIRDSINISFSAIYLVQVTPKGRQYTNIKIGYKTQEVSRLAGTKSVRVDSVEAQKGDFLAAPVRGIKMTNLFDEPRKFTLRGQLKAAFSGSYRAIVALQVPAGATDVLYSLRISTNEKNKSTDGDFYRDMETSYRRIKVLGLPIYESHRGSGLIATLLGENVPPREEDAYINMYVFYNAAQAKKFQDGADPSKLSYNVDYSTMGTQSCNGCIPSKGYKTIYLGFLNERMRYNNYVWLEALSAVPHTEYFKPVFTVR
ncbi:MAG: hypothetical protein SOY26_09210, partial [Paludibacteraceae bacterium]|nr:hypothetical protein [Paludibacteraceae bacterium]